MSLKLLRLHYHRCVSPLLPVSLTTLTRTHRLAARNFRDIFALGTNRTPTFMGAPFNCLNPLPSSHEHKPHVRRSIKAITVQPDYRDLGHLVYKGRHRNTIQFLKTLYFINIAPCLAWSSYNLWWYYSNDILDLPYAVPMIINLSLMVAMPTAIHAVTRNIITEMYFNPNTKVFTATVVRITGSSRAFSFTTNDVKVRESALRCSIIDHNRRKYFVSKDYFRSLDVYKLLFGVDK